MPAWGDTKKLTPQQIADVIAYVMSLNPAPASTAPVTPTTEMTPTVEVARPSNPGGPGPAIGLTGNVTAGEKVFVDNCKKCHGDQGVGGVANPGSDDGTIPPLNPIDRNVDRFQSDDLCDESRSLPGARFNARRAESEGEDARVG